MASNSNTTGILSASPQSTTSNGTRAISDRGPRPRLFSKDRCQADGCRADLRRLPWYNRRNHICMEHKVAEDFARLGGQVVRFCQRCGIPHPLTDFDGPKKSCRRMLQKHNARRRKGGSATTSSSEDRSSRLPTAAVEPSSWSPLQQLEATSLLVLLPVEAVLLQYDGGSGGGSRDPLPAPPAELQQVEMCVGAGPVLVSERTAEDCNERVCCSSGNERVCGATDHSPCAAACTLESGLPAADLSGSHAGSATADASGDCASGGGALHDDPHADADSSGHPLAMQAALTALQQRDAAVYAALVYRKVMQAQALLTTAGLLLHTMPALSAIRT